MQGWIKIHRQLLESSLFTCEPFSKGQAWISIIMLTNHKEGYITVKNGNMLKIERGECGYSELALAKIFKWSRGKVKRFLMFLENEKMIQQKIVENHSIIKVLNYEAYQDDTTNDTTNSTTNGQQTIQQTDINKNDKNDKNDKNIKKEKLKFGEFQNVLLSDYEYQALKELYKGKLNDAIETLSNYLQSKGDKYKNHYAVMRKNNWVYDKVMQQEPLLTGIKGGYNCGF